MYRADSSDFLIKILTFRYNMCGRKRKIINFAEKSTVWNN